MRGDNNLKAKQQDEFDASSCKQFLTFLLGNEEYGIDILSVVEIRCWEQPTAIPASPAYIKGVINLRGSIVPVADLRIRFNMPEIEHGPSTVMIILQIKAEGDKKTFGIVVDGVSDVCSVSSAQIQPKPTLCESQEREYISSLITVSQINDKEKLIIVLEPDKIFDTDDLNDSFMNNAGPQ